MLQLVLFESLSQFLQLACTSNRPLWNPSLRALPPERLRRAVRPSAQPLLSGGTSRTSFIWSNSSRASPSHSVFRPACFQKSRPARRVSAHRSLQCRPNLITSQRTVDSTWLVGLAGESPPVFPFGCKRSSRRPAEHSLVVLGTSECKAHSVWPQLLLRTSGHTPHKSTSNEKRMMPPPPFGSPVNTRDWPVNFGHSEVEVPRRIRGDRTGSVPTSLRAVSEAHRQEIAREG